MRATRLVALVMTLAVMSGCRSWQMVPTTGDATGALPSHSRLTHTNGQRMQISNGRITPDSVIGVSRSARVALSRDSVERIEARRVSWARTAGLVVLYFGMAFVISGSEAIGVK